MTKNQDQFLQTDDLPSRSARTKEQKKPPIWGIFKRKQNSETEEKVLQKTTKRSQPPASAPSVTIDLELNHSTQVAASAEEVLLLPTAPLEPKPNELAFYEALNTVQEQASALAIASTPASASTQPRKKLPLWVLLGLAGSLVVNLGAGYLVYKYRKDNQSSTAKPAATTPAPATTATGTPTTTANLTAAQQEALKQLAAQQAADTVPIVKQEVAWSLEQKEALSKGERTRIESVLSAVKKPDDFKNGSFNFVFVTGINQVQAIHEGSGILSAFVSNGYLKGFSPKLIKLNVYYGAQLILSGTYAEKRGQWAPNDVYLIAFDFTPNDIRDAAVLDKVSKSPTEQTKLRFEARIAFDQASNKPGGEKEEKWELMNTHTDVPVIKK